MDNKTPTLLFVILCVGTIIGNCLLVMQFQTLNELKSIPKEAEESIHVLTVCWPQDSFNGPAPLDLIKSEEFLKGYVWNWTTTSPIRILQVEVWMGNPYNITWEGDVIVTLDNTIDLWYPPSRDEVLVHYQFDSHAESGLPHSRSFNLRPGFYVPRGETIHIYRLFHNCDEKDVYAGDGWVVFYYLEE
jgi:hypothetical protein